MQFLSKGFPAIFCQKRFLFNWSLFHLSYQSRDSKCTLKRDHLFNAPSNFDNKTRSMHELSIVNQLGYPYLFVDFVRVLLAVSFVYQIHWMCAFCWSFSPIFDAFSTELLSFKEFYDSVFFLGPIRPADIPLPMPAMQRG